MEEKKHIKDMILEKYPNVTIRNECFLNEEVLNEFSLEEVAFQLCQLDSDVAWDLYMNLYQYGNSILIKEILKFLIKNDILYFNNKNNDIYNDDVLIKEYVKLYGNNSSDLVELKNSILLNESNNKNKKFIDMDINYLNTLIKIQKMYQEKKLDIGELKKIIQFQTDLLLKDFNNYEKENVNIIQEIISYLVNGKISIEDYYQIMSNTNCVLQLLLKGKFGFIINDNFSLEVIDALSVKKINRIFQNLLSKNLNIFYNNDFMKIVIKMCSLLGEDNVDNIIRHLPNDVTMIKRLLWSFKEIDISNVKVENRKIVYNKEFIKFFMGNNLDEPTSLLNLIYHGKTNIDSYLETLYYSFDKLNARYKKQNLLTRTAFFEIILPNSKVFFNPDEYLLEGDIINSYFYNKKHQSLSSFEFTKEIKEVYGEMKHNYQKTIPYVSGRMGKYLYETLRANDPSIFTKGAETNCCFKIGGQADNFVRYCAISKHGRVIAIKDENGEVVAMIPVIRNGNLVVCNSIESNFLNDRLFMSNMFQILEEIGYKMIDISNEFEKNTDKIQAVLCGNYKNEINKFQKYQYVKLNNLYDCDKIAPLNDMGDNINCNLGLSWGVYCISGCENFDFNSARVFEPSIMYEDPRGKTYELEREFIDEEFLLSIQKRIDSISFECGVPSVDVDKTNTVIFNEDWYVIVDKQNKIHSAIVGKDSRALYEYQEYLRLEQEYCQYYDQYGIFNQESRGR